MSTVAPSDVSRWIPSPHLGALRSAHDLGRSLLLAKGFVSDVIEEVGVAEMVEAHRWAWRPTTVRLILMAESHVFTKPSELSFDFGRSPYLSVSEDLPSRYVRLIYCLAYGEKLLAPFDGGTPQFWSIFGTLAGTVTKHQPGAPRHQRLMEWIRTLRILRDHGVWLLDASLHAVSLRKGVRQSWEVTDSLQRQWWGGYGKRIVEEAKPERIVAIGKGVHEAMSGYVRFSDWIYQPQGVRDERRSSHNAERLGELRDWL